MTQGWRKFVWNESSEVKYAAEKAQIKGRLVDHGGRPFKNHKVLVVETNDSVFTDNDGFFVFDNLKLDNGLTIRSLDLKGYKTEVKVNDYCNYFVLPDYLDGTIVDKNGSPVNNALITYLGALDKTRTNSYGTFTIPKLKEHNLINITHDLYKIKQVKISSNSIGKIILESQNSNENQIVSENVMDDKQIGKLAKQLSYKKTEGLNSKSKNNRELLPSPKNIEVLNIVDDAVAIEENVLEFNSEVDVNERINFMSINEEEVEEEPLFIIVEKMPEFPGGELNLRKYIAANVTYPEIARECCIEGKVYVRFAVNKNGTVERVSIARGVDPILDNEVLRVVKNLPKWQPDEQSGRKVTTWYTVPIVFNLIGGSGCGVCPEGQYCIFQIGELKQRQHTTQQTGFYRARQFYSPDYEKEQTIEERTDFRPTVYWNPSIKTEKNGKAQISFYNSDEISSFKVIAEGISSEGVVGRGDYTFYTQLPFTINAKIPEYLTFADELQIPVTLINNTSKDLNGTLHIQQMDALVLNSQSVSIQQIKSSETKTVWLDYKVQNIAGKGEIQISFESEGLSDVIRKNIEVLPKGFPIQLAFSSNELKNQFTFDLEDMIPGSLNADFKAYPNIFSNLMQGIESILREPYGCFEQTSSSTYPNLLVLDYMKSTGDITASIKERALSLTDKGYKRLIGFETSEKGYEWFGHTPAHEGLTAYGLMEFTDMAKVYENVDNEMIKRTRNWLLNKRDGKGGFTESQGKYGFSYANYELKNAYLVYALSESGYFDIGPEFLKAYEDAITSNDAYKIALIANTAFNLKKISEGHKMLKMLDNQINKYGFGKLVARESIVRSQGKSLQIETASLYLMALLKSPIADLKRIDEVVNYIAGSRDSYGGFSSTQATVLALKSLTEYAKKMSSSKASGDIELKINYKNFNKIAYGLGNSEPVGVNFLQKYFNEGKNIFSVQFKNTDKKVSYSLSIKYNKSTPESSDKCILELSTKLNHKKVNMGDIVRMNVNIKNKTGEYTPMAIVKIGIPSGLSLQPYQLKELLDKKLVDYYEIFNNYLVFYFTSLQPAQEITIPLDLKTELPGNFEAPASSAYLYYTNEFKHWVAGEKIEIR